MQGGHGLAQLAGRLEGVDPLVEVADCVLRPRELRGPLRAALPLRAGFSGVALDRRRSAETDHGAGDGLLEILGGFRRERLQARGHTGGAGSNRTKRQNRALAADAVAPRVLRDREQRIDGAVRHGPEVAQDRGNRRHQPLVAGSAVVELQE